jgi:3-deoxy-7-phosphoheptulonate synthase
MEELPIGEKSSETVAKSREQIQAILRGDDDRLLVVVGPCSVHDPVAALDYAHRLKEFADRSARDLLVAMRVYFEKPRPSSAGRGSSTTPTSTRASRSTTACAGRVIS